MSLAGLKRVYRCCLIPVSAISFLVEGLWLLLLVGDLLKILAIISLVWDICCLFPSFLAHKMAKGNFSTSRLIASPTSVTLLGVVCLTLSIISLVSIQKDWKDVSSFFLAILNGSFQGTRGLFACLSVTRSDWLEAEEEIPLKTRAVGGYKSKQQTKQHMLNQPLQDL
jgi:hypothetical protein